MVELIAKAAKILKRKRQYEGTLLERYKEIQRIDTAEIEAEADEFYEIRRDVQKKLVSDVEKVWLS